MGAHQKPAGELTQKDRMLHFICEHPGCTSADLRGELGYTAAIVSTGLFRLKREGLVANMKTQGVMLKQWIAIEQAEEDDSPIQVTVKEWEATAQRDPLVAALFWPEDATPFAAFLAPLMHL